MKLIGGGEEVTGNILSSMVTPSPDNQKDQGNTIMNNDSALLNVKDL